MRSRLTRGNVRLWSGLVLLAFVVCHLTAHSFLIISIDQCYQTSIAYSFHNYLSMTASAGR